MEFRGKTQAGNTFGSGHLQMTRAFPWQDDLALGVNAKKDVVKEGDVSK